MRVITWNRSFKGIPNFDDGGKDEFDSEEHETHATVLDKLLAWEKKLYDEVKVLLKLDHFQCVHVLLQVYFQNKLHLSVLLILLLISCVLDLIWD